MFALGGKKGTADGIDFWDGHFVFGRSRGVWVKGMVHNVLEDWEKDWEIRSMGKGRMFDLYETDFPASFPSCVRDTLL